MRQLNALRPLTELASKLPFPDKEVRDGRINLRGLGWSDPSNGQTMMLVAATNGYANALDLAEWLCKHGAQSLVNKPNHDGDTPLMCASERGHVEIAQWLLSHGGAATDTNDRGETPLQLACRNNHLEIAQFLLGSTQADIHSRCNAGRTPLLEAVMESSQGHSDCMHWLLANGAAQDAAVPWSEGSTPLMFACQYEDLEVVKLMFASTGSDANHLMATEPSSGTTPIISACRRGHLELAVWLVEKGVCNLESANSAGNTPIMFALTGERFDILQFLVDAITRTAGSARVLKAVNHTNPEGATPLNLALELQHIDWAEWLIQVGADLSELDNTTRSPQKRCDLVCGRTLMHRMAGTGNLKAVEWLVASGARGQVATADSQGCTPMLLACQRGDLDMAKLLYHNGARQSIETPDKGGVTPIQLACRMGHLDIVKWLEKKGAKEPDETLMLRLIQGLEGLEDSEQRAMLEQHGCVVDDNSHLDLFSYLQRDRLKCSCCQEVSSVKLRACAGCHMQHYCGVACQRNHWKTHKETCRRNDYDY